MLLVTFSGRTPELLSLVPHLPPSLPLLVVTSHTHASNCPLFFSRPPPLSILLPAPIHVSETQSFGLPAPTSSTTAALALTDALALALARRLHPDPKAVFHAHHPGGAIGAIAARQGPPKIDTIATRVDSVPIAKTRAGHSSLTARDIILAAARSPSGWVRLSPSAIIAPRRIQQLGMHSNLDQAIHLYQDGAFVIEKTDWISIPVQSTVSEAKDWILRMRDGDRGKDFLKAGTLLGIVDVKNIVSAVVEIEDVVGEDEVRRWEDLR